MLYIIYIIQQIYGDEKKRGLSWKYFHNKALRPEENRVSGCNTQRQDTVDSELGREAYFFFFGGVAFFGGVFMVSTIEPFLSFCASFTGLNFPVSASLPIFFVGIIFP